MNLRPVKLYRVYLEPLNSSNVGDFSQGWILKGFIHFEIEKGKFVVVCPRPPYYVALGGFTSQSCSGRRRNVLKSVCCFPHKTNFFLMLFSSSPQLLKVPNDVRFTVLYGMRYICSTFSWKAYWVVYNPRGTYKWHRRPDPVKIYNRKITEPREVLKYDPPL